MDPREPWLMKLLAESLADKRTYTRAFLALCGVPLAANQATMILETAKGLAKPWRPIETVPKDGSKFDAWAVHPDYPSSHGARFTDVQMRADQSGFGVVLHLPAGVHWEYLEREGPTYPVWRLTHWMPPPAAPTISTDN